MERGIHDVLKYGGEMWPHQEMQGVEGMMPAFSLGVFPFSQRSADKGIVYNKKSTILEILLNALKVILNL